MDSLKNSVQKNALNETDLLARIRQDAQKKAGKSFMTRKAWLSSGVAAALLIAVIATWGAYGPTLDGITPEPAQTRTQVAAGLPATQNLAYAMVSVDINPSLELYTDKDGIVLEIKARNHDAQTLKLEDQVGKPAEEVVKTIIQRATDAGFIKPDDSIDDYVIVSTVALDEGQKSDEAETGKNLESLGNKIQQAVEAADLANTTKVAVIKATLQEKHSADKNGVPLGLYIINGMVTKGGQEIPVAEFVKEQKNVDKLAKRADIVSAKEARNAGKSAGKGQGTGQENGQAKVTGQ